MYLYGTGTGTLSYILKINVADPGCLSRFPDPDFCPFRIQKQQPKREVKKKFVVLPFFVATEITKLEIILILNW
jgi:hypothetical protein